jgi:hypothetical protein
MALEWGYGTLKWDGSRGRLLKFLGGADKSTKISAQPSREHQKFVAEVKLN